MGAGVKYGIFVRNLTQLRQDLFRAQMLGAEATAKRIELQIALLLNKENNGQLDNELEPV